MDRSKGVIREKIRRWGLRVVISGAEKSTTPVSLKEPVARAVE